MLAQLPSCLLWGYKLLANPAASHTNSTGHMVRYCALVAVPIFRAVRNRMAGPGPSGAYSLLIPWGVACGVARACTYNYTHYSQQIFVAVAPDAVGRKFKRNSRDCRTPSFIKRRHPSRVSRASVHGMGTEGGEAFSGTHA
jgi:hypothetical protein